jgi:hypothetical protein
MRLHAMRCACGVHGAPAPPRASGPPAELARWCACGAHAVRVRVRMQRACGAHLSSLLSTVPMLLWIRASFFPSRSSAPAPCSGWVQGRDGGSCPSPPEPEREPAPCPPRLARPAPLPPPTPLSLSRPASLQPTHASCGAPLYACSASAGCSSSSWLPPRLKSASASAGCSRAAVRNCRAASACLRAARKRGGLLRLALARQRRSGETGVAVAVAGGGGGLGCGGGRRWLWRSRAAPWRLLHPSARLSVCRMTTPNWLYWKPAPPHGRVAVAWRRACEAGRWGACERLAHRSGAASGRAGSSGWLRSGRNTGARRPGRTSRSRPAGWSGSPARSSALPRACARRARARGQTRSARQGLTSRGGRGSRRAARPARLAACASWLPPARTAARERGARGGSAVGAFVRRPSVTGAKLARSAYFMPVQISELRAYIRITGGRA